MMLILRIKINIMFCIGLSYKYSRSQNKGRLILTTRIVFRAILLIAMPKEIFSQVEANRKQDRSGCIRLVEEIMGLGEAPTDSRDAEYSYWKKRLDEISADQDQLTSLAESINQRLEQI